MSGVVSISSVLSYWSIERAGRSVTVAFAKGIDAQRLFGAVFADFGLQAVAKVQGVLLAVQAADDGWHIVDQSVVETRRVETVGDLIYFLSDKIIFHLANVIDQGHCLHAACVAKGDDAYILPGNSGNGKSSLTCWMVANGYDYVTDELTILLGNNRVSSVPRPIQIKSAGLSVIKPLLCQENDYIAGHFANAVSATALGGRCATVVELNLRAIIFPVYESGVDLSYQPLAPAAVAMELMGSHINARNVDQHGFRFMADTARQIPAHRLHYGGFEQLSDGLVCV